MADQQAGWYPDPLGDASKLRYWDGTQWTNDFTEAAAAVEPVVQPEVPAAPEIPAAPVVPAESAPVEPVQSYEPAPVEPVQSYEPAPVEPVQSYEPAPVEPVQPYEVAPAAAIPVQAAQPADSAQYGQAAQPYQAEQAQPYQAAQQPYQAGQVQQPYQAPQYPGQTPVAPAPKKKTSPLPFIIIGVVVLIIIILAVVLALTVCSSPEPSNNTNNNNNNNITIVDPDDPNNNNNNNNNNNISNQTTGDVMAEVGKEYATKWFTFTVKSMKVTSSIPEHNAASGSTLMVASITVTNTYGTPQTFGTFDWVIIGDDDYYYVPLSPLNNNMMPDVFELKDKESATYDVVIEYPSDLKNPYLMYIEQDESGQVFQSFMIPVK